MCAGICVIHVSVCRCVLYICVYMQVCVTHMCLWAGVCYTSVCVQVCVLYICVCVQVCVLHTCVCELVCIIHMCLCAGTPHIQVDVSETDIGYLLFTLHLILSSQGLSLNPELTSAAIQRAPGVLLSSVLNAVSSRPYSCIWLFSDPKY